MTEQEGNRRESIEQMLARGYDPLADATQGKYHWNDPGMDAFEQGWQEFTLGTRVEVRIGESQWLKGTVVETIRENDRGIHVECDEKWHDDEFLEGKGWGLPVYMNTRRGILSQIRRIDEEPREFIIPRREPKELEEKGAELLRIAKVAVDASQGRLRLAYNEEDDSEKFVGGAQRFLKFDGSRIGRDIEFYDWMGRDLTGWEQVLPMFLQEALMPIAQELPESYKEASEELKKLGETVYEGELQDHWRDLFSPGTPA